MKYAFISSILPFVLLTTPPVRAGEHTGEKAAKASSTQTNDVHATFLINNLFNYYSNNGEGSYNHYSGSSEGLEFPKGGGKTTTYSDGVFWGAFLRGDTVLRAGGSMYRQGLQAGRILTPGTASSGPVADDPALPRYRLFRVRPDVHPGLPFDAVMETKLNTEEVVYIARYQALSAKEIYDQYILDWTEWPASDGAPFEDLNGDGQYEPAIDIPGVPGTDQTLWYVANDLNDARVASMTGSTPIGIEMQKTIWGYSRGGTFGNTIFQQTKIINKSGRFIDSLYIGHFTDPDIGDAGDDYVGCDTLLRLGYAYNGYPSDVDYGTSVPAVGLLLLGGPIVQGTPADTAFDGDHLRVGSRNLPMSAFAPITGGSMLFPDPYNSPILYYRILHGMSTRADTLPVDPVTGQHSSMVFSGDPVAGTGWLPASMGLRPMDFRFTVATGPQSLAPGDTAQITVAHMAARGTDRLASVYLLKEAAGEIRSYLKKMGGLSFPSARYSLLASTVSTVTLGFTVDARRLPGSVTGASLILRPGSPLTDVPLADDGTHNDGTAGDRVYAGSVTIARQQEPLSLRLYVRDGSGTPDTIHRAVDRIITIGDIDVTLHVFLDNFNDDGKLNPGELIRFGVTVRNRTQFVLRGLTVTFRDVQQHTFASIDPGSTASMEYDPASDQTYFTFIVPEDSASSSVPLNLTVTDTLGNFWASPGAMPVTPLPFTPQRLDSLLVRSGGRSIAGFSLLVVDPAQFRNHLYTLWGSDSINARGDIGINLKDLTDGRMLLQNHPLPEVWWTNMPLTDGFKVITQQAPLHGAQYYTIPNGFRRWSPPNGYDTLPEDTAYFSAILDALDHWPSGGAPARRLDGALIRFASTDTSGNLLQPSDTTISWAYRYVERADRQPLRPEFAPFIVNASSHFAYQDYTRTLPFAVYDSRTGQRLMVGFSENNSLEGSVNGKYWPPSAPRNGPADNYSIFGPHEQFFIFDLPYSSTPAPELQTDIEQNHVPLIWYGNPARRSQPPAPGQPGGVFASGDEFRIVAYPPFGPSDSWIFRLDAGQFLPTGFALLANYPNPFNPRTTITFIMPARGHATLTIYDLLGRRVKTLLDEDKPYAGEYRAVWDGTAANGTHVASGVYFYSIHLTRADGSAAFTQVKKMMLIR